MGKKTGLTRPMTIDVLLPPFIESFSIVPSDAIHQWYNFQESSFLPDHAITPLYLVPTLSVNDPETKAVYQPSFYKVRWFLFNGTNYNTEITNTVDGNVDYVVMPNGTLKVKKNVGVSAPVSLRCQAEYIDPRNVGNTYTVSDIIQLVTSQDATIVSPTVEINSESTVLYNPFVDGYTVDNNTGIFHHNISFTAKAYLGEKQLDLTSAGSKYRIRWYAIGAGISSETLIDETEAITGVSGNTLAKFPCYVSGQNTSTLTIDAMFAGKMSIIARVYDTSAQNLYPDKAIISFRWESFKVDATTEAIDGGAVKQSTTSKTLRNIVTLRNRTLSEDAVNENFIQEWFFRTANSGNVENLGKGPTVTVGKDKLTQSNSSLVYSSLELMEQYAVVVDADGNNGKVIVDANNKVVICRT